MDLDVEVFATGEWGGMTWTTRDLDEMVANFNALGPARGSSWVIRPPVKLGHEDKQILGGQKGGQPALGWVQRLVRQGEKLVATLTGIPEKLGALINDGRYKRVSSEIYPHWEETSGEKNIKSGITGRVFSGLALLGADIPEVKTLEDLANFFATDACPAATFTAEPLLAGAVSVVFDAAKAPVPELVISIGGTHPRTLPVNQPGTGKTDKDDKTMLTEAQIKEMVEGAVKTALETAQAKFTADLKVVTDANAAALATANAEITRLTEANKTAAQREAIAQAQADAAQASRFVEERSSRSNFRLFPSQQAIARVLHVRLSEVPATIIVKASEATELKLFGEKEQARDLSLRDLFERFCDSYPNKAGDFDPQSHDTPEEFREGNDDAVMEAALNTKAKELYSKPFEALTYDERKIVGAACYRDPKLRDRMPVYKGRR